MLSALACQQRNEIIEIHRNYTGNTMDETNLDTISFPPIFVGMYLHFRIYINYLVFK